MKYRQAENTANFHEGRGRRTGNDPLSSHEMTLSGKYLWFQEGCLKKVTDLTMIYYILPKQPTNPQASFRTVQLVKRQASDRKVVGSIPAQTTGFFGFLFFSKKQYVCFFRSQKQPTNLLLYLTWGGQKTTQISPRAGFILSKPRYPMVSEKTSLENQQNWFSRPRYLGFSLFPKL